MKLKGFLAAILAGLAILAGTGGPAAEAHTNSCYKGTIYKTINYVLFKDVYQFTQGSGANRLYIYDTFKKIDNYWYYVHTHYRSCPNYV